jgi:hypothetical protein
MSTLSHAERCTAGAACLQAALQFHSWGIAPLCCCDPDHVAVGQDHAKGCASWGKVPVHLWKPWQTKLPPAEEVQQVWHKYPLGNVGIVLGQGSGVVRIDVDGATGPALLAQWSGGELPDTWEFLSPSGGHGWLYGWDKAVPCRTTAQKTKHATHEELRLMGNGSQTIVPPSRHVSGGVYTWVPGHSPTECALAPAPDWLVARLREPPQAPTAPWEGPRTADAARVVEALAHIPAEDYDDWLKVGMALHHSGAPWARDVWDTWSKQSDKFDADKQGKSWASFGERKKVVTLGSLFYLASQQGWSPPEPPITGYPKEPVSITGWTPTPTPIHGWAPTFAPVTGWKPEPLTLGEHHA